MSEAVWTKQGFKVSDSCEKNSCKIPNTKYQIPVKTLAAKGWRPSRPAIFSDHSQNRDQTENSCCCCYLKDWLFESLPCMWSDKDLWTCPDLQEPLWPLRATEPDIVIYGHIWSHDHIEQIFIVSLFFKSDENSSKYKRRSFLGTCIPRQESVLSARQPAGL